MGHFVFSHSERLSPLETVMREWHRDALLSGAERTSAGLELLFRRLMESGFPRTFLLAYPDQDDPKVLERFREDRGFAGAAEAELRRKLRMQRASRMLLNSQLPVEDISATCGYQNLSQFYADFKTVYQKTPLAYRKELGV